ncbi:hypothetical protein [Mesobacillus foraminis]|uniref:hypothetical protein n=1 Tax=Mesobacillus foraminis TaxID=279826 RepID=UPI000EF53746|nr:hypothetical protein [Mesobacillus foraminis]
MKGIIIPAFILSLAFLPIEPKAEFLVPALKETDIWKVELKAPSREKNLAQGQKRKYDLYSLLVTNKGKKVYNVHVQSFRSQPGTSKMFGLAPEMQRNLMVKGDDFKFLNFPVKAQSEALEFIITWEDKPMTLRNGTKAPGKKYKESFIFTSPS